MSLKEKTKEFAKGVAVSAVGAIIGNAFLGSAVVGAIVVGSSAAIVEGSSTVLSIRKPQSNSFLLGIAGGASLAFHLVANDAPKTPDVPVNDNAAITQQQLDKALSCEDIAKKCGLELK